MEGENGRKVRAICVPKFSLKKAIVLVNLSTLESEAIRFTSGTIQKAVEEETTGDIETAMNDIEEL